MFKRPILVKSNKFIDKRGFFQEIYKKEIFKLPVLFTAIAYSKKM